MEYGREILGQLQSLHSDVGGLKANVDTLRRDFDRAREESSDRYDQAVDRLEGKLERLEGKLERLQLTVSRCPQHAEPDAALVQVRKPAGDSGRMRAARRGVLRSLGLLFGALATALSGWWASHRQ